MKSYGINWESLRFNCKCGKKMNIVTYLTEEHIISSTGVCECGVSVKVDFGFDYADLPTRLEGSE